MRVWLAPSRYAPHLGGIETVVAQLASELRCAGDEVLVVTHRHPAALPGDGVVQGQRVRRLSFEAPSRQYRRTVRFLRSIQAVRRHLRAEDRPDVIHIHGSASQTLHLTYYAWRAGIPLLLTTHGEVTGDTHAIFQRSYYARASFRIAAHVAKAVTAPSAPTLREAIALAPDCRNKAQVVPNGIRAATWAAAGPTPETHVVLAWGRLERQKGFDRLVTAWPHLRKLVPDAELRLAGEGSEGPALAADAGPGVRLLGRLSHQELIRELRGARLAAVPSRVEAFGMSALEALAAGRRVVHAGLPAVTGVVRAHGLVLPHDDPEELARGLAKALLHPPAGAPGDAVAGFEWPNVARQYRSLYTHLDNGLDQTRSTDHEGPT